MGSVNIERICQLMLICIWRNEISYGKSDCSIIQKFYYPNNLVCLLVRIKEALPYVNLAI